MAGRRMSCGLLDQPGERGYACVEPPHIQTGEGTQSDSEDECTALATLPPEMVAQLAHYLGPSGLAAFGSTARTVRPLVLEALERAARAAIADRFPEAWRLMLARETPGGAPRTDLAQRCAEWGVSCERPCAAIAARMAETFRVARSDLDQYYEVVDPDREDHAWRRAWLNGGPLSDVRFRETPGNARFYARPAPVRERCGVGDALPVFFPGNTVCVAAPGVDGERCGVVGTAPLTVLYDQDAERLTFTLWTHPARPVPLVTFLDLERSDSEWIRLVFRMPSPFEPTPGEDPLVRAVRYLDHIGDSLGVRKGGLTATAYHLGSLPVVDIRVRVRASDEAIADASRYFAANGFPAGEVQVHTLERAAPA